MDQQCNPKPVWPGGAKAIYQRNHAQIRAWVLAQERPVTVDDAKINIDLDRTALVNHLNRLAERGEIASAKVKGKRWRYYGRREVMEGLQEWKHRREGCDEGYEKKTLLGPEGLMWSLLEQALDDASKARKSTEEWEEIWSWFADTDQSWFFSCASICAVLEIDQWAILEMLREKKG